MASLVLCCFLVALCPVLHLSVSFLHLTPVVREIPPGQGAWRADSGTLTWARHTVTAAHGTSVVVTRGDGHTSVLALGLEGDSIAQEGAAQ